MWKIHYLPTGINNFHNSTPIALNVRTDRFSYHHEDGEVYKITKSQAQRIKRHFCGIKECWCPAGAVIQLDQDGNEWAILKKYCRLEE